MFGDNIMLPLSCGISTPDARAPTRVPIAGAAASSSVNICVVIEGGGGVGTGGVGGMP